MYDYHQDEPPPPLPPSPAHAELMARTELWRALTKLIRALTP